MSTRTKLKRQWCLPTAPMPVSSADIMQWAETSPSASSFLLLSEFPSAIQMEWSEGREDFHYHWGHNVALNILKTHIRLFFPSLDARERQKQKHPTPQNQTAGVLVRCAAFCFPERCRNQETKAWRLGCSSSLREHRAHEQDWRTMLPGRVSLPCPIQAEKTPTEHRITLWGQPGIVAPCCFLPTAARIQHARHAPARERSWHEACYWERHKEQARVRLTWKLLWKPAWRSTQIG